MQNELKPGVTYTLPLKNGYLDIRASMDPEYPGLDVEYIKNNENPNDLKTRPRVVIEWPKNSTHTNNDNLRCLVWADKNNEDYSQCIEFEK